MIRIVVIEPKPEALEAIRTRFVALDREARFVSTLDEARDVAEAHPGILVIYRGSNVAARAAGIACGFDLDEGARLVLFEARSGERDGEFELGCYLQELDHLIARFRLPQRVRAGAGVADLPDDFPYGAFEPLRRLGGLPGAEFVLLRNRVAERKEIVVQIADFDEHAAAVSEALFCECSRLRKADRVCDDRMFRIEMTRNHSYVWMGALPLGLADGLQAAAARPPHAAPGRHPSFA